MSNSIEIFNLKDNDEIVSPCLILHGKIVGEENPKTIHVSHPQLPSLSYPVNENHFRATVILTPGENKFKLSTDSDKTTREITCTYVPMLNDQPVHLCLLVAKDSEYIFDSPKSQIEKEGGNGLDLAIRKLRLGGRLMQAYTNEQMLRNGFGNRTFQFVEEFTKDTLFKSHEAMRSSIKVHILHSDRTVSEIRDHDVAQQNKNAKRSGALYEYAMEAMTKYGGPFTNNDKPVQAAVIYLDAHWDQQFITGHAALGGGNDTYKLAIFGSHGLYSWPTAMEEIVEYFTDTTIVNKQEVANDNNECGSHWECLTVTLGAFLHEIGHSLGCPHQEYGVMLRGYPVLNRSFLTKEAFSTRTNSYGVKAPITDDTECKWHRLDLLRFLYHPSFTLPSDYYDETFGRPSKIGDFTSSRAAIFPLGDKICNIKSETGVYSIEVFCGDLAYGSFEYLPKSIGGTGPQKNITLTLEDFQKKIPENLLSKHSVSFGVKILSINAPEAHVEDFAKLFQTKSIPMEEYGFDKSVQGIQSITFGSSNAGDSTGIISFDPRKVNCVRIFSGRALDGMQFFSKGHVAIFGNETRTYVDFEIEEDEYISGFNVRSGQWIDAIQVLTSKGRKSQMCGNLTGGSLGLLVPPEGHKILGMHGNISQWLQAIGIVYGKLD